ncbi:MAG: CocE/NonD family hydrolase [Bacteroidia bacterium]|nr:CocE/NonD family hydrolase [Bacteroidia bacterium]
MKKISALVLFFLFIGKINAQLTPIFDSVLISDGKYLHCDVYKPAGCTGQCPTILIQTPYGKWRFQLFGLPLGVGYNINSSNYIFVVADWRGTGANISAAYAGMPTRGKDGKEIVQWIASQSWSDGKIGTWGPSALGKVQFDTAKEYPPNLTCICPLVAAPQTNYLDYYPGGCIRTEYLEQLDALGFNMSAGILMYPFKSFAWNFVESTTNRPDSIPVPALMIGGWYDHNIESMLSFFAGIRTLSPVAVRNQHRLLMGPWAHGGSGAAHVGTANQGQMTYNNAEDWNDSLALLFFDYHLRGITNNWNTTPYIQYYQMGENNWHNTASWPPSGLSTVNYYLHDNLILDNSVPATSGNSLNYLYDPQNPSPTIGGAILRPDLLQGPWRQDTAVENRSDILVFSTPTLTNDVTVKGKIQVHLKVASDRKDTDFAIRLCDVDANGKSMLVQTGIVRMRFRNGFTPSDTAAMIPGTIYSATVDLANTAITFVAGHKIRVDVSSSNYPQYNRNMNTNGTMYPAPNGLDTLVNPLVATNTVYMNSTNFSYVSFPVDLTAGISSVARQENNFEVFPNPTQNDFTIRFKENFSGTISLCDVQGRVVSKEKFSGNQKNIFCGNFENGVYFLKTENEKIIQQQKIIIYR